MEYCCGEIPEILVLHPNLICFSPAVHLMEIIRVCWSCGFQEKPPPVQLVPSFILHIEVIYHVSLEFRL